jgi:hypothetical protein
MENKVLTSITCNSCGVEVETEKVNTVKKNENKAKMHNFEMNFEYGSEFESQKWNFDLCEKCLRGFVENFQKKPEGFEVKTLDKGYPFNE